MTTRRSFVCALAVAAAISAGCDVQVSDKGVSVDINEGGRVRDEWSRTYNLPKGGHLEVEGANGDIEVVAAKGGSVEVHVRREVRARNDEAAKRLLKEVQFNETVTADRVTIQRNRIERPDGSREWVRTDYRIAVPPGLNVSVKTDNGRIGLDSVEGRFTAGSTNGQIEGRALSGGAELTTVNGSVELTFAAITSDVRITTVNGHIIVGRPPDANGTIEATTVNGGTEVREGVVLSATERERRRLSARLGTGNGPRIELRTTNGGVHLRPADLPPR